MARKSMFETMSILHISTDCASIDTDALRANTAEGCTESFSVVNVGPTGISALDPCVAATLEGRTALFADPDQLRAEELAASLKRGELPTTGAAAVVEHSPETMTLPNADIPPLATRRRVLAACSWTRPTAVADYAARGPILTDEVGERLERAAATGLVGRGRGDIAMNEPVVEYWETATNADGDPIIVVHANEADPRVNVDSLLLASDPLTVLDPAVAVADLIGATELVVYLSEDDSQIHRTTAVAAARLEEVAAGDVSIDVVAGPDEYAAGEPTMALEALEGAE